MGERNDEAYVNSEFTDENGRLILEVEEERTVSQRKSDARNYRN
jgi:hypothetical protein